MSGTRRIRKVFRAKPTVEGAGVHLKRVFGFSEVPAFDPRDPNLLDSAINANQRFGCHQAGLMFLGAVVVVDREEHAGGLLRRRAPHMHPGARDGEEGADASLARIG